MRAQRTATRSGTATFGVLVAALAAAGLVGCAGLFSREPLVNISRDAAVETLVQVAGSTNTAGSAASVLVDGDASTGTVATYASVLLPVPRPVTEIHVRAPDVVDMDILIREPSDGRWRRARRFTNCHGGARLTLKGSPTLDGVRVRVLRSTTDIQFRREEWRDVVGAAGHKAARDLLKRDTQAPRNRSHELAPGWGVIELEATTEDPVRRPVSYVRARIYEIEVLGPG